MSFDLELEEIHKLFFEECAAGLDLMEAGLLALESRSDPETVNTIFRAAHSIKGGAATFGFSAIAEATHGLETFLDGLRNGTRRADGVTVRQLLECVDGLRAMILGLERGEPTDADRLGALHAKIADLLAGRPAGVAGASDARPGSAPASAFLGGRAGWIIDFRPSAELLRSGNEPLRLVAALEALGPVHLVVELAAVPPLASLDPTACYLNWRIEVAADVERGVLTEIFDWLDERSEVAYRRCEGEGAPATGAASSAAVPGGTPEAGSLRVSTDKLDQLINLVGELVITQSMLARAADGSAVAGLDALQAGLAQLTRNTRELQESVMQMRMLPIGFAFNRLPRLVHDLSAELGKRAELILAGEATELDKTVLERISDPLVHLVRNALDHGIESPAERHAAGKAETGKVTLSAFHEGGHIIIEVSDDGGGLNRERILARARARGLVAADTDPGEEAIHQLVFAAGFSTADAVSAVSGRGVGMDVVRRNIEGLGGQVQIRSTPGLGSTIRIRLPLTLAILDGQLVRVGGETYVIALAAITETVKADEAQLVVAPDGGRCYRLREEFVPIVPVGALFGLAGAREADAAGLLVIVESDGGRFALGVNELLAQQQVVIKSLERNFRAVPGIAGGTILGDGAVALILDVPGLVELFNSAALSRRTLAA